MIAGNQTLGTFQLTCCILDSCSVGNNKIKKYLKNSRTTSFLGLLPASKPEYVIYIMIDEPKPTKETFGFATAGWTAAPTAGRVLERMISLYGLEPVEQQNEEVTE